MASGLSRNVFRGIAVCSAIGVALMIVGPVQAKEIPPPLGVSMDLEDSGGVCTIFEFVVHTGLGVDAQFNNDYSSKQTVNEETAGFYDFTIPGKGTVSKSMTHAGEYQFWCGGPEQGLNIPVSAPSSHAESPFTVTWAISGTWSGYTYSVQYKIGSDGSLKNWKKQVGEWSDTFRPGHSNVYYYFRAETWKGSKSSDWSPWHKIHVT